MTSLPVFILTHKLSLYFLFHPFKDMQGKGVNEQLGGSLAVSQG